MKKAFRFRLYPSKKHQELMFTQLEAHRSFYNQALQERKQTYEVTQKGITYNTQAKILLPNIRNTNPQISVCNYSSLQRTLRRLDKAFQAFFRRIKSGEKPGYPRFKGKDRFDSIEFTYGDGIKLRGNKLYIGNIGLIRIRLHRPILGDIKSATLKYTNTGKWFITFSCDRIQPTLLPPTGRKIGIDVGCESFLTDSNGDKVINPRFLKNSEDILIRRQQVFSRKKRGSTRRKLAKQLVAKIHEKIQNQRTDFHFKVAHQLTKNYDTICIEKMDAFNSFRCLNRSMRDVAWFNFFNILKAKAVEAGREVIEVPARGTSQLCSQCGTEVKKNLSVRIHNCPSCHLIIDRDYNAALNILRFGQSLRSSSPRSRLL